MKILHAANFALYPSRYKSSQQLACHYSTDRTISHGLSRLDHCIFDFSIEDAFRRYRCSRRPWPPWSTRKQAEDITNDILLQTASRFEPDLLILGHARCIRPDTLEALRHALPALKIIQWWVDALHPSESESIRWGFQTCAAKLPFVDALLTTTSSAYARVALSADGEHADKVRFMPNPCNTSVHSGRAFENEAPLYDAIFTGRPGPSGGGREDLATFLAAFPGENKKYRIAVRGDTRESLVGGAEYIRLISQSKTAISVNRFRIPLYASDRMIHIVGNGALALCENTPEMEKIFAPDEVVYFDDVNDLKDKLHHYLQNDDERRTVARKAWERAHSAYSSQRVAQYMLDCVFDDARGDNCHWCDY